MRSWTREEGGLEVAAEAAVDPGEVEVPPGGGVVELPLQFSVNAPVEGIAPGQVEAVEKAGGGVQR